MEHKHFWGHFRNGENKKDRNNKRSNDQKI
jgi:hypothetical protein